MFQVVVQGVGAPPSSSGRATLTAMFTASHACGGLQQTGRPSYGSYYTSSQRAAAPHPQQLHQLCSDFRGQLCGGVLLGQEGRVVSWCQVGVAADLYVWTGAEVIVWDRSVGG